MTVSHDEIVFSNLEDYHYHLGAICHNNVDAISIFDSDGCFVWCNDFALDMFKYTSQIEVTGKPLRSFVHSDYIEGLLMYIERANSGEKIALLDHTYLAIRKDGTTFPAHSRAVPIYVDEKFVGFQAVNRDLSEINQNEHRLRSSLSAIDLMASLIQHDMRNDIQIVENALDVSVMMLEDNSIPLECISIAKSGLCRMKNILEVLAPTIIEESGRLEDLIEESLSHTKEMHPDIKAIFERPITMKPVNLSDRRLLAFVFDNLFRNSEKYAGPSSTIFVRIEIFSDTLQIDIVDDGPGIPEKLKTVLFERGTSTSGSGLGLYICRRIIEGYNGMIELLESSSFGKGAAFRITLPLDIPDL